ncbi:MAG: hypothetical protein PVS3B3_39080 [Ktedonobacteraceae bacterium]
MIDFMKNRYRILFLLPSLGLLLFLAACGTTATQIKPQQTVVVDKSFQSQVSPLPTTPAYRCGAWSGNNAPGAYSVLTVYAKLTKNVMGFAGATASATVHFSTADFTLDQQPVSDGGGYVTFTIPLQGRQPRLTPATVDVSFNVNGKTVQCSSAFFTPV